PLIMAEKGRIAMTSSVSGILAGANTSTYVMSKHAIEGFTDSLAAELALAGVYVSAIEPGNYRTEIAKSMAKRLGGKFAERANGADKYQPPDDVATAFAAALSEPKTNTRPFADPDAGP